MVFVVKVVADFNRSSNPNRPRTSTRRAELVDLVHKSLDIKTRIALKGNKYGKHLQLYKATLAGDWKATENIVKVKGVTTSINHCSETILHIAVEAGKSHLDFVKKLVDFMPQNDLEVKDIVGNTALAVAAIVGNTKAAEILVQKNRQLLYICNDYKYLPVHEAAVHAQKGTLHYLHKLTTDKNKPCPDIGEVDFAHLLELMAAEFYDIALCLVKKYPQLATLEVEGCDSPLTSMAKKTSSFPSGTRLGLWERLVYSVPRIKKENQLHSDALQLVKSLCKAISSSHGNDTYYRFARPAILEAAKNGIPEVVEEIVDEMPLTIWSKSEDMGIFQFAVVNRCEKVFNLIYQMGDHKQRLLKTLDGSGNNILHLAGQIAPLHKLNLVSGAALQMQRELQWYEEVEKLLTLPERQKPNRCGMTPKMLFSKGHEKLVIDGEKWMINTANSCTIAAALIVTIVFAAAITVPGGLDQETGKPIYSEQSAFKLFFVSNAISLFTATTSLLMFLSILTARYAEEDFRFSLPNRLIIGLVTLFVSTTAMMIAFSSILYIVFGQGNAWSILPTIGLACLPVTSFVALQFPLLVDVISSTYGRGVFGKQSSRRLY